MKKKKNENIKDKSEQRNYKLLTLNSPPPKADVKKF